MQKEDFICIYCCSRKDKKLRSEEHIIPKNIHGKFTISDVCSDCNSSVGALVDTAFPQYIKFAEYLKTGLMSTDGIATLGDGSQVSGIAKIVEQRTDARPYSINDFITSQGVRIKKSDIKDVKFLALSSEEKSRVVPGIAKIAYAGMHYLLNYKYHKFRHRNFVIGRQFEGLRQLFCYDSSRYVGRIYKEVTIADMPYEEQISMIRGFNKPEARRHFLLVRQEGRNIEIQIILLSWSFWKVKIHNYSLPVGVTEVQAESLLDDLNPLSKMPPKPSKERTKQVYIHVRNPAFKHSR